jgi:hypothetical protein
MEKLKLMRKQLFFVLVCLIFFACNSTDNTSDKRNDSLKNAMLPLIESMQQQLQQFPDSTGLRLQYAFILDSVDMHREALDQLDTLLKKTVPITGFYLHRDKLQKMPGIPCWL